jgi:hypothetical protein
MVSNEEIIVTLTEKDIKPQKEKIEKLIIFEKEKYESDTKKFEYDKKYKEMFKDEEIKKLVSIEEFIKRFNYFDYSFGKIRSYTNKWEDYKTERPSTPTIIIKYPFVKEFILLHQRQGMKSSFIFSRRGL